MIHLILGICSILLTVGAWKLARSCWQRHHPLLYPVSICSFAFSLFCGLLATSIILDLTFAIFVAGSI